MSNLIHISGIDQAKVIRLINAIADEGLDSEGSITKVEILSTPEAEGFVVRPNGNEWDFWVLCDVLRERCIAKKSPAQIRAWCHVKAGMFDLPKGKYYVGFGDAGSLLFCGTKGRQFRLVEPEPDGSLVAEEIGRAVYPACPQQTLTPLADGQGVIMVGKPRAGKLLKERIMQSEGVELLIVIPLLLIAILGAASTWDFKETVLPSSFPNLDAYLFYYLPLALIFGVCYSRNRIVRVATIAVGSVWLLFSLAFAANSYIHTEEGIHGQGVIVENVGKDSTTNNYVVHLLPPEEGQATVRMHHDGSFSRGDVCTVVMDRSVLGLLHVDSLAHRVE